MSTEGLYSAVRCSRCYSTRCCTLRERKSGTNGWSTGTKNKWDIWSTTWLWDWSWGI